MRRVLFLVGVCLWTAPSAWADSWASAQPVDLESTHGDWTAHLEPNEAGQKGHATAVVTGPEGEHRFELRNTWMPVDTLLLNDGRLLTLDEWHSMGYGDSVAVLYTAQGEVLWHRTLVDLLGEEGVNAAPRSVSSIWWRKGPLEWSLSDDSSAVVLTLWDENKLSIALEDGSASIIEVKELGDDPERLIRRARAKAMAGEDDLAIELFERVLELEPNTLDAYTELGQAYSRKKQYDKTITLLEGAAKRWGTKHEQTYNLANLYRELAIAHAAAGDTKAAEATLRTAIPIEPSYATPVLELARLLEDQKRSDDIDALMQAFYEANASEPYRVGMVVSDIADYYNTAQQPRKAIAWYEKIYSPDAVSDMHAYLGLARAYEALGENDKAQAIHTQLIAYWKGMGGTAWDSYIQRSKEAIDRLE